jgi:hypothetical protein
VKNLMTFSSSEGLEARKLHDGSTRHSLAEECRMTALSFMSGVAQGWTKVDLALWLSGPYARATRHGKHEKHEDIAALLRDGEMISAAAVEDLLTHVRGQLLASLEKAALDFGTLEFSDDIVGRGLVRKVVDAEGQDAWVPVDGARMRLRDRLRSLFTADYLNAPYTYAELFVCHRCEAVVFDAHAKQISICGLHRMSAVVLREPDSPARAEPAASDVSHGSRRLTGY